MYNLDENSLKYILHLCIRNKYNIFIVQDVICLQRKTNWKFPVLKESLKSKGKILVSE